MTSKLLSIISFILIIALCAAPVLAAETELRTTIDSVTVALDKNQRQYVRLIISEQRTSVSGIPYTKTLPVMVFGEALVETAKGLKKGDALNAIAELNDYKGRESYNVLAFIPAQ